MKPFRFRLDRLCKVRRLQEEQERVLWLEAEMVRREAETAEQGVRSALNAAQQELRTRQAADALGILEVLQAQGALERTHDALRSARERTLTATYHAERMRVPWEERRKEVRGLERLEERARMVWRHEELQRETKEMDEVARRRAGTLPGETAARRPPASSPARPIRGNSPPSTPLRANAASGTQGGPQTGRSTTGRPASDRPKPATRPDSA